MKSLLVLVVPASLLAACTAPDQSSYLYVLPYAAGTEVTVLQDHVTHPGKEYAVDMVAVGANRRHQIVAGRAGVIRFVAEGNTQGCVAGCADNYVWIQHVPGTEWTKYAHLAPGSVSAAGLSVGDSVRMGQVIGVESNIGSAEGAENGRHLHHEVREVHEGAVPTGLAGDLPGTTLIPRYCVHGQITEQGLPYYARPCDPL